MFDQLKRRLILGSCAIAVASIFSGCTVHPPGEREERVSAKVAGKAYDKPFEERDDRTLPERPTLDDLLSFAMLNSADLESRYWQWRAVIEQIPQDGTQSTTLNLSLGSAITRGRSSSGMTTIALSNDPMTDIKWPGKLDAAARMDLENARASGLRFRKAQFELRARVISAEADYALTAELIRLEEANQSLLQTAETATEARNRAGSAGQGDLLKTRTEIDLSRNGIDNLKAQLPVERALLNALLSRPVQAPLPPPAWEAPSMLLITDDGALLSLVAKNNSELSALSAEGSARADALHLAKLQYIPDFNLSAGTDLAGITQSLLGQATIPLLRYEALNAAIEQARANLRSVDALRRQSGNDLAAQVIGDITIIRDADRQLGLFDQAIVPRARQSVELLRTSYETGHVTMLDLLEGQRTLISIQRLVANLHTLRVKRIADLESIASTTLTSTKN